MDEQQDTEQLRSASQPTETTSDSTFRPPSIHARPLLAGDSYTHYSPVPRALTGTLQNTSTPCVLGVDEAGRGPVLGPMVYGVFYCAQAVERALLATRHQFDDSKVLTAAQRSRLMRLLCATTTPDATTLSSGLEARDGGGRGGEGVGEEGEGEGEEGEAQLHSHCGWATTLLSAQSISAHMLRSASAPYNLNAQAVDATIALVRGVLARGVNVVALYVDTIGRPEPYEAKLAALFPMMRVTVAKKADSLFPCVSAASVCAKVTRDAALEVCAEEVRRRQRQHYSQQHDGLDGDAGDACDWGSGYPSDARCVGWLKQNMHPLFGWGNECRFSWGTAKEMLEGKKRGLRVDWAVDVGDEDDMKMTSFLKTRADVEDELASWYGRRVGPEVF